MATSKIGSKQYKILVKTGKEESNRTLDVEQGAGDRGQPIKIKAQAGVKYQLQEVGQDKPFAPQYVKAKRVGKDLHITFEDDTAADVIIEDYYNEMPPGYNGVIGQAENGAFYEYLPEDPTVKGLIPELADGGQGVNVALGGQEVQGAGAALAVLAINPLLAALGAAGAAAAAGGGGGGTTTTTTTGGLASTSDTGARDNITKNTTPEITGKATAGATVKVTINGVDYTTTADANGNYTVKVTNDLPDGTYTPKITVTPAGSTTGTTTDGTAFTIDHTPPTIAITADKAALLAGQSTTVTFTLSEAVTDFTVADVQVTGGTLSNFQGSGALYTATFTPNANSTATSTVQVTSGRFSDVASNFNTDGADANNNLALPTNTTVGGGTGYLSPNSDTGAKGDNLTNNKTPGITGTTTAGATVKVTINGVDYTATADANGNYSIPAVNSLPDGTYTPKITITPAGSTTGTTTDGTPFTIDTTAPTIAISADKASLSAGQTTTITFTTSEVVSDFTAADVSVTGGTLSNFAQSATNPTVYTATFTPNANSTTTSVISVASAKFSDAAANFNTDGADANNTVSLSTNTVGAPTVAITSDHTSLKAGDAAIITFTLSEASSDFTAADVSVTGGTLSNFAVSSTDPKVYHAVFTPTASSTTPGVISVASNKFSNAAGTFNTDGADAVDSSTKLSQVSRQMLSHLVIDISLLVCG